MLSLLLSISLLAVAPVDVASATSPEEPIRVAQLLPLVQPANPVPIAKRPDRTGHWYGNAVRRRHRRGAIIRLHPAR